MRASQLPDRVLTPTAQLTPDELQETTFSLAEPDPDTEVLLHLNTLTDNDRLDFERWIMQPDPATGLRTLTIPLPLDGAYSYRFVRGTPLDRTAGASREGWMQIHAAGEPDPNNPNPPLKNPLGKVSSVFRGPRAPQLPDTESDAAWQHSTITHADGRERSLWHLPATAEPTARLVLFDGEMWADAPLAAAFATAHPTLEVIAVGSISIPDRARDLTTLDAVEQLLDEALAAFPATEAPLVVGGQSFGGLAAATLAIHRPDRIAAGIAQSGSYWHQAAAGMRDTTGTGDLLTFVEGATLSPEVRLVLQVGSDEALLRPGSERMCEAARAAGASASYTEYRGGHDYAWWHPAVFDALAQLLD